MEATRDSINGIVILAFRCPRIRIPDFPSVEAGLLPRVSSWFLCFAVSGSSDASPVVPVQLIAGPADSVWDVTPGGTPCVELEE
jgi:hypothetical protein